METSQTTAQAKDYTDDQKHALILSMCTTLMNKVKLLAANPKKNRQLASNAHLTNLIELLAEHILPQYCVTNYKNSQKLSIMHSLCFLLASKVQAVFNSGVIRTCIDQNWDMKGFKSVLLRILQEIGLTTEDYKKLQEFFDKLIQSQNLQSQSCIKAISQFLRAKSRSNIDEDDLQNPIVSFQTTFPFVKAEIEKFRSQNMSHTCFTVLHPWAYDLDLVDFKYVINKDQTHKVCETLKSSVDAQVFWLSYFKSQLSTSADEFFGALKELCFMNHIPEFFGKNYNSYKKFMIKSNFVISLAEHAKDIERFVSDAVKQALATSKFNILGDQIRLKNTPREKTEYFDESKLLKSFIISPNPDYQFLNNILPQTKIVTLNEELVKQQIDLKRSVFTIKPTANQGYNLYLRFTNVDTEELKDLEIKFDGNLAQFKVGEGDFNHYVISNDKKLWESQFMILNHNGKYYIRDLGIVHTSRIKVNPQTQLQIHQGALLDLGKVVHYHVDKLLHEKVPNKESSANFIVMKGTQANYRVDEEAILRARPTWISADENKDLVQNEIILEPTDKKQVFSVGRSNRRDVEIKLKAVSADHCKIEYNRELGWFIHEKDKERLSSNGTFVFMKSLQQMDDHEPSDIIPLFNGMTVSFINYELQVRIEPKSSEEVARSQFEALDLTEEIEKPHASTTPVKVSQQVHEHPSQEKEKHHQKSEHKQEEKHHAQHEKSQKSLKSHHEEKEQEQEEQEQQEQEDPYDDQLQATYQQKSQASLHEHHHPHPHHQPSQHSIHSNQQDDEEQKEVQSQHSHRSHHSSKHSVHSLNQNSVHQDAEEEQQNDQQQDMDKQSERSVRQSHQSLHSSASKHQPLQQEEQQQQQQDDDMRKSVQSVHSQKSQKSVVQAASQHEDQQHHHVHSHHHTQQEMEEERKSHVEDSPKQSAKKSRANLQDEDEQPHEMLRSYSQHHIGEVLDQASKHNQSQHQLVHSDNEEDDHPQINDQDQDQQQQEQQRFSVHHHEDEEVKSQKSLRQSQTSQPHHHEDEEVKSQKSLRQSQTSQPPHHHEPEHHHQAVHEHQDQQHHKESHHSLHQEEPHHNQSVHEEEKQSQHQASQKSLHQSVHHESQKSLHEQHHTTHHNQSVHEEEKHHQPHHEEPHHHDHQEHQQDQDHEQAHHHQASHHTLHQEQDAHHNQHEVSQHSLHQKSPHHQEEQHQPPHEHVQPVHHHQEEPKAHHQPVHEEHKSSPKHQPSHHHHQESSSGYEHHSSPVHHEVQQDHHVSSYTHHEVQQDYSHQQEAPSSYNDYNQDAAGGNDNGGGADE